MNATTQFCRRCGRPLGEGLFCRFDGTFVLDEEGTVVAASRGERLLAWFLSWLIFIFTLGIGWTIWWFIVAPRGQNPGKAIVGIRVIRKNGNAVRTGGMLVRGLAGAVAGFIPFNLDELWIFWDRDVQTLHDKIVDTVVVKARGSERIVEAGGLRAPASTPSPGSPSSTAGTGAPEMRGEGGKAMSHAC